MLLLPLFQFKRYVNKLRGKSNIYKKKRQEMAELKTECGILSRTVDILQQKESAVSKTLVSTLVMIIISNFEYFKFAFETNLYILKFCSLTYCASYLLLK